MQHFSALTKRHHQALQKCCIKITCIQGDNISSVLFEPKIEQENCNYASQDIQRALRAATEWRESFSAGFSLGGAKHCY
jgi:hypothetical protein